MPSPRLLRGRRYQFPNKNYFLPNINGRNRRIERTNMSRSLNPPGPAYCDIPAAVEAMATIEDHASEMSECILHEFPTELPHVHTLSRPQEHKEYRIG